MFEMLAQYPYGLCRPNIMQMYTCMYTAISKKGCSCDP